MWENFASVVDNKMKVPPTEDNTGSCDSRKNLRIVVNDYEEEERNQLKSLGEPISLSSPSALSPVDFDKITQLPTPILNNSSSGTFSNFPLLLNNLIDVNKNRGRNNDNRVISEYRPISSVGRKNSLLDNASSPSKRFVSNPIDQDLLVSASTQAIPSPPIEKELSSKYYNRIFESKRNGKCYKFVCQIGSGNFSTVVLANNVSDEHDRIAIKIISVPLESSTEMFNFKSFIKRELNILYNLSHPCIIHLVDYDINFAINQSQIENVQYFESEPDSEDDNRIFAENSENSNSNNEQLLFFNYCSGGNLFQFLFDLFKLNCKKNVYWKIIERVVIELLVAIGYLHSNSIVHRDIKLENVLLNYSFDELCQIMSHNDDIGEPFRKPLSNLSDFGLSKRLKAPDELLRTRCGSKDYISPEILMGLQYNGKLTDSWSFGVLIYALLENRLPFDPLPLNEIAVTNGISPSAIKRRRAKNSVAHRIAMIDWDWFTANELLNDESVDQSSKIIITRLKDVAEVLLVRKDKRKTVSEILYDDIEFPWIKSILPSEISYLRFSSNEK
ncbi:uncharacterized protein PRCAT00006072001 [Priceomyces carsonii]|uniref:uncharacterized protein n=1 Tax=Priceomyces carsonii TaxID=28549 RepID=UPI002EDAA2DE|nr:unnamed protein product [Priceomyces carsonii]